MDIPIGIVNKLCCDLCKNYLSCGPIYLNYKTNHVICGRCSPKIPKKFSASLVRYKHYETLASVSIFPCKYSKHGCPKKLTFSGGNMQKHEITCEYRKRACPIVSSKTEPHFKCKWYGRLATLLHHCKISHPDNVISNPCVFEHVFNEPMHETYLITCFNTLFLLNITISNDIVYDCRHIGTKPQFKYVLKVFGVNTILLIKDGTILPEIAENTKRKLTVNTRELAPLNTAAFILTIQLFEPNSNAICCRAQKNGCTFNDIPAKTKKHETYFCKYTIECPECNENFGRNLPQHLVVKHGAQRAKTGNTWHIQEGYKQYCVLTDDDDVFYLCKYSLACYRLLLTVFTPLASEQLQDYTCEIRINDPGHCYKHKLVPVAEGSACYDWIININMYNYPMWRHYGLDLSVFIGKKGEL